MRKVWVTRTLPGAQRSAKGIKHDGYEPVIAPLIEIVPPGTMPAVPDADSVLILTSQNALNALVALTDVRHWPLIAVGDATARRAKFLGFNDVVSANGTSTDITAYILNTYTPGSRSFIHVAGDKVRGAICEDLTARGFDTRRDTFYVSRPVTEMPEIDPDDLFAVLLYSPLAAHTLAKLSPDMRQCVAVSLSPAVDNALGDMRFQGRHIAATPTEPALLTALDCAT